MSDVQFDEPEFRRPVADTKRSLLATLVIRTGLASDDAGAQKVLLTVLILVVLAIIAVWTF